MELKEIKLPFNVNRPILALGSQTKNTVCFAKGRLAVLSPVHPDLSNPKDFLNFEKSLKYFLKKRPKIISCDLHPEYQSSKYCQNLRLTTRGTHAKAWVVRLIQHHHAHIASCMAENGLKNQEVIGVAFDGTGLGTDNSLWGAEFLVCDYKNFKRVAHLKQIPLLGGEKAVLEPWRLVAAWFLNFPAEAGSRKMREKWQLLKKMYTAGFNSPLASSMGRLFDAVASLVLKKYKVNSEAELAIELERIATSYKLQAISYKFKIIKDRDSYILDPAGMFKEIITDLRAEEPRKKIAYRFHLTVAQMISKICLILRREANINTVALSGGVFQNNLLLRLSLRILYKESFKVFIQRKLPCNDSGISLGQIAIANFRS